MVNMMLGRLERAATVAVEFVTRDVGDTLFTDGMANDKYPFAISEAELVVYHDCPDFRFRGADGHFFCKHLFAVMSKLPEDVVARFAKQFANYVFRVELPPKQPRQKFVLNGMSDSWKLADARKTRVMDVAEDGKSVRAIARDARMKLKTAWKWAKILRAEGMVAIKKGRVFF